VIDRGLARLPEELQREVYDFVRFLKAKRADEPFDGLALSESALARTGTHPTRTRHGEAFSRQGRRPSIPSDQPSNRETAARAGRRDLKAKIRQLFA